MSKSKKRKTIRKLMAVISLVMILVSACSPEALQALMETANTEVEDQICTDSLVDITVDDLVVPQGATCTLDGTRVMGNITVEADASLTAYAITVEGNLQAEEAGRIEIHPDSYVGGNIQVEESGSLRVESTNIAGNLESYGNMGDQNLMNNMIAGDLQINNTMGNVLIEGNTIEGDLECEDNDPAPIYSGNTVYGDREGQCYDMADMDETDDMNDEEMVYMGDDYECTEELGAVVVDDLYVPMNTTCTLNDTEVRGDISVYEGGSLFAYAVRVEGDIEAEYAKQVEIHPDSYVGGDIEFKEGGALLISSVRVMGDIEVEESYGEITIIDSDIQGNVQIEENTGAVTVRSNSIEGDLQIEENTGGVTINQNMVSGDLECEDNDPAPTTSGNTVYGDREGQCYQMGDDDYDDNDYDDDFGENNDYTYLGDDYECSGTLESVMVDDLIVPMNSTCTLQGVQVKGNISVYEGAVLYAYAVDVGGNLQAEYAENVEISQGSYVGGNIQFVEGGALSVSSVTVMGNIEVEESYGPVDITNSTIHGDVQLGENSGGITVNNNMIYSDLECEDNYPEPSLSGNTVHGDREGQCTW